jgi:hypothetical protein
LPQAAAKPRQHVGATDRERRRDRVGGKVQRPGERDGLACLAVHGRVRGVRRGERREAHGAQRERVAAAAGIGRQDASRDLGRRAVVARDRAGGRVDANDGGFEHARTVSGARRRAIDQRDDSFYR